MLTETERTRRRERIHARRGFYMPLVVYLGVNGALAFLNYGEGPPWWVLWPVIAWGIFVLGHAIQVFVVDLLTPAPPARHERHERPRKHRAAR